MGDYAESNCENCGLLCSELIMKEGHCANCYLEYKLMSGSPIA